MATGGATQRRQSVSSDDEEHGAAGGSRPSRPRCPSFSRDDDNDEERAKEIEGLKKRGILPKDFPVLGSKSGEYSAEEVAKEIQELLAKGSISEKDAEHLIQMHEMKQLNVKMNVNDDDDEDVTELIPFQFDCDGIPVNWSKLRSLQRQPFILVDLKPGQMEYDKIMAEFTRAKVKVTKIERLQNLRLLDRFKAELEEMKKHRSHSFSPNICYLYHGTSVEKSRICEEGLDQRLSRMGYFGKGIYFSDTPIKCVHYSEHSDRPEEAVILKCRVILGDAKAYEHGCYDTTLKREPEKENPVDGYRYYDSVMGCPKDYNEYVVYENRRAMIEYIISFKVEEEIANQIKQLPRSPSPKNIKNKVLTKEEADYENGKDEIPENAPEETEEEHFLRISEVREMVRKKRCEEQCVPYYPPTPEQLEKEKVQWREIKKQHIEYAKKILAMNPQAHEDLKRQFGPAKATTFENALAETRATVNASKTNSTHATGIHSMLPFEDEDPVELVFNQSVAEFLSVTNTTDSEVAKHYLQKTEMNLDLAIVAYYEDHSS
ncbi:hypothetical protein CHS0354_031472 [Potamilus streckersoni]|uniref:Poly [ADP-ribose] polymerase n=1 Tax=Potamilus streckersoni TaxID=2493646 RepID=A0AAE0SHT5_9BIVA|nr:hypothetical protein CHS0354_031472 [Potamilus streckersoni]